MATDVAVKAETDADRVVGPPLAVLAVGGVSVLLSYALLLLDTSSAHLVGWLLGSLVPILAIGYFRRMDLQRRRSSNYVGGQVKRWLPPAIAIAGVIAAGIHTWLVATQWAS